MIWNVWFNLLQLLISPHIWQPFMTVKKTTMPEQVPSFIFDWHVSVVDIHCWKFLWIYCTGHASMKRNDWANGVVGKAAITCSLCLRGSDMLRSLRHYLCAQSQGHHIIGHQEERGMEEEALSDLPWKDKRRASSMRWTLEQFKGFIGKTSERQDGVFLYGVFWACRYHLELNWIELNWVFDSVLYLCVEGQQWFLYLCVPGQQWFLYFCVPGQQWFLYLCVPGQQWFLYLCVPGQQWFLYLCVPGQQWFLYLCVPGQQWFLYLCVAGQQWFLYLCVAGQQRFLYLCVAGQQWFLYLCRRSTVVSVFVCCRSTVVSVFVCHRSTVVSVFVCHRSTVVSVIVCRRSTVVSVFVCRRSTVVSVFVCPRSTAVSVFVCPRSTVVSVFVCRRSTVVPGPTEARTAEGGRGQGQNCNTSSSSSSNKARGSSSWQGRGCCWSRYHTCPCCPREGCCCTTCQRG